MPALSCRAVSTRICTLHRGRRTSVRVWEASKAVFPCQLVVPSPLGATERQSEGIARLAGRPEQILRGTVPTQS